MNDEFKGMWKDALMCRFEKLSRLLDRGTEEHHRSPQSGELVCRRKMLTKNLQNTRQK
jgi:hypothetical protein